MWKEDGFVDDSGDHKVIDASLEKNMIKLNHPYTAV